MENITARNPEKTVWQINGFTKLCIAEDKNFTKSRVVQMSRSAAPAVVFFFSNFSFLTLHWKMPWRSFVAVLQTTTAFVFMGNASCSNMLEVFFPSKDGEVLYKPETFSH